MGLFGRTSTRRNRNRAADAARDRGAYAEAARLYEDVLAREPANPAIHVQAGHMWKEARRLDDAERHYLAALALAPDDADLALQLGHFHKLLGRLDESEAEYRRALALDPASKDAQRELASLLGWGWRSRYEAPPRAGLVAVDGDRPSAQDAATVAALADDAVLVPELVPEPIGKLIHAHAEEFYLRRLGREERSRWGMIATLRGIEAIRGFWASEAPITEIAITLNGHVIHRDAVHGPYLLKYEAEQQRISKYVFNEWLDFARFEPGRYLLAIEALGPGGLVNRQERHVAVAAPLAVEDNQRFDSIVDVAPGQDGTLDERINAAPSVVRPARRTLFETEPRTILVMRTDQLGDMVASIPAMQHLRALFPQARIVGLLTTGNADFAATLGLFDEILIANFPDDPVHRRRVMGLDEQKRLKAQLAPYRFDLAIDLADAGVSRPLLLLSGAPMLFGFRDREFRYLFAGQEGNTHDPNNRLEIVGHSTQTASLIKRLEAMMQSPATLRRQGLSPDRLTRFGLSPERPYVLLHAGARIEFSRWPHHPALVRLFLERTGLDVVMMGLEGQARADFPAELIAHDRVRLIEGLLPFDDFDALISFSGIFVGNDSGPKHLASLRGANVVGLHLVRNNWNEWGQEHSGVVMSRRVPCAGCNIYADAEECGKDFVCLRNITAEEVFAAGMALFEANGPPRD